MISSDENSIVITSRTTRNPSPPYYELELFLKRYPHSPGARFVELLKKYLHNPFPSAERLRLSSCLASNPMALCLSGVENYRNAYQNVTGKAWDPSDIRQTKRLPSSIQKQIGKAATLPLWENREKNQNRTAYHLQHFRDLEDEPILSLGTHVACLPLQLAGASVQESGGGTVVELGPFAGFSSKCLVAGLSTTGIENAFVALDSFEFDRNFNMLAEKAPWVLKLYPKFFTLKSSHHKENFLPLWQDTVQTWYPTAKGMAGLISWKTLNPTTLGKERRLDVLSVDSIKYSKHWVDQLRGLGKLQAGTILFLLDFDKTISKDLFNIVYGCLRGGLLPVYASFGTQHWAFVLTRDLDLCDPTLASCYRDLANNKNHPVLPSNLLGRMEQQIEADVSFLWNFLGENLNPEDKLRVQEQIAWLQNRLYKTSQEWNRLANTFASSMQRSK